MIRYLSRKEINEQLWNDCIHQSIDGQAFFYTWYLDACCPDWSALVEDNYAAVFPFAHRNKLGIDYIYQALYVRHFGLITRKETSPEQQQLFLDALPASYKYMDFSLHQGHHVGMAHAKVSEKIYQTLDLKKEYAAIRKGYNENLNRNLKKAEKQGYKINQNYASDSLVEMFKTHRNAKLEAFSKEEYERLNKLMQSASQSAVTYCWAVQHPDKEVHAGAFFIKTNKQILYLKGFSTAEGKKSGAMHYLFDQLIRTLAGQTLLLDFGGSSVKSVARFYHSFGSADCLYLRLQVNLLPKAIRWIKR